jgi:hypothetical protein
VPDIGGVEMRLDMGRTGPPVNGVGRDPEFTVRLIAKSDAIAQTAPILCANHLRAAGAVSRTNTGQRNVRTTACGETGATILRAYW